MYFTLHRDRLYGLCWILSLLSLYWFASSFFLAKRSLAQTSKCHDATRLWTEVLGLDPNTLNTPTKGCWMDRQVDSAMIVVVDALRFDFALRQLPHSLGKRFKDEQLFQFVADPPTVTMQRLKALTTGGLPTFADISNNFGGGTIEEDSWVQLLQSIDAKKRGLLGPSRIAFVGDDTWHDLFPTQFTEAYPYPSFNTRDLDTVDNGCLKHIPDLLERLRRKESNPDGLELVVVHFLGVDHVGHTYGPVNEHMDRKLRQMDDALSKMLDVVDSSNDGSCHAVYIFGDHGMTSDGNHGGGTDEEVTAALFAHFSPACLANTTVSALDSTRRSELVGDVFASIHQIDLVPSLSFLLGLPIPYANLGSFSPSLVPQDSIQQTATALALNSAQVWQYFNYYSEKVNRLPDLDQLEAGLKGAAEVMRDTYNLDEHDRSDGLLQASILFKLFLAKALDLGQRVWTKFDDMGMIIGILGLSLGLLGTVALNTKVESCWNSQSSLSVLPEMAAALSFLFFQCGMLTFSNSYILEEECTAMFCLSVLSLIVAARKRSHGDILSIGVLLVPVASRLHELFVSGHGLDPSSGQYRAHSPPIFLPSLFILAGVRWYAFLRGRNHSLVLASLDLTVLLGLSVSWWEKSHSDVNRNGYWTMALSLGLIASSGFYQLNVWVRSRPSQHFCVETFSKLLLGIMCVSGPASATSSVFYCLQVWAMCMLSRQSTVPSASRNVVIATMWRLVTRHMFFATNHGCFFNRLQYSAAFVATEEFYFITGGIQLFLNTFGYEMIGLLMVWFCSHYHKRHGLWHLYGSLQLFEALSSCLSVSLLRRHLMVWDIFSPRFIWTCVFTAIAGCAQLASLVRREGPTRSIRQHAP